MSKNTGKEFESFVESIYQKMIKQHETIEKNVWLEGPDKKRQIDILITGEIAGCSLRTIIECRDYNSKLSIGQVDGFESKMKDVNANVGIMVTTKGFSSKAISKAKRLGISLLTAHEILNDKWRFDQNIQILIKEISPKELSAHFSGIRPHNGTIKFDYVVNDINIYDLIKKKWADGSLNYQITEKTQEIHLDEIKKPYQLSKKLQSQIIHDIELKMNLQIRYFTTSLHQLKGTKILNNVIKNELKLFIPTESIKNSFNNLKEMKSSQVSDFAGITIIIKINDQFPNQGFVNIKEIG